MMVVAISIKSRLSLPWARAALVALVAASPSGVVKTIRLRAGSSEIVVNLSRVLFKM
jgi:hypothetical protein